MALAGKSKKKNLEIERRYLLKNMPNIKWDQVLQIFQYYHPDGFRYRKQTPLLGSSKRTKYFRTFKKNISKGVNKEIEDEITFAEFKKAVKESTRYVVKHRYLYQHNGLTWEVDSFASVTLIIAEVELETLKKVTLPDDIKKELILEITGKKQFSNFNLSKPVGEPYQ